MMCQHFCLRLELARTIRKIPHCTKNQLSVPRSFFNQFHTDILTNKTPGFVCLSELSEEVASRRDMKIGM